MTFVQALVLGLVQGITEFLPVSSDGHLVLAQHLLGIQEPPVAFDIFLHLATLTAIVAFFWREIWSLSFKNLKFILVATLPTGIIGLIINRYIDTLYNSMLATGTGFLVTTIFLLASKTKTKVSSFNLRSAVLIGIFQGLAVLPGVSRSGTTISTALILGLSAKEAFTFSFLAAIPAILGAQVVGLSKLGHSSLPASIYLVGGLAAAVVGFLSIKILKSLTYHHRFHLFAIYTAFIALITLLVLS